MTGPPGQSPAPKFREVDLDEALRMADEGVAIVDVREPYEWKEGHIPSATLVPLGEITQRITEVVPDRAAPILVHCAHGRRSARAAAEMGELGYTNVTSFSGAIRQWQPRGGAWEVPGGLTDTQRRE